MLENPQSIYIVLNSTSRFIEVKSQTDSLSSEQYKYFEDFLTSVSKNILVLRVLPENSAADT